MAKTDEVKGSPQQKERDEVFAQIAEDATSLLSAFLKAGTFTRAEAMRLVEIAFSANKGKGVG
jgi:hypothetical protein